MKTTRAFSVVSYNTREYLTTKLNELILKRDISFYAFIYHYKESDEAKDHIHLYVLPNGRIDTDRFCDYMEQIDPTNINNKPLKCVLPRFSTWVDWYLYGIHDPVYLNAKGQQRTHFYTESDMVASDNDALHELVTTIDRTKYYKTYDFIQKVKSGATFDELLMSGQIPIAQLFAWKGLFEILNTNNVVRNGRSTHTPLEQTKASEDNGGLDNIDTSLPPPLEQDSKEP